MIIRVFLISIVIVIVVWFMRNHATSKNKALKKIVVILLALFAVLTILLPGTTNDVAQYMGVGRGADLLLYLLTMAFIAYALNQYIHSKAEEQRVNELARKIAIIDAQNRYGKK